MSIASDLRNIFDQYEGEENRLTHALLHTIAKDNDLCEQFLKHTIKSFPFDEDDEIVIRGQGKDEQRKIRKSNKKKEDDSIPDAWICDSNEETCIIVESKVTATPNKEQLKNHMKQASFTKVILLLITADLEKPKIVDDIKNEGKEIYWQSWQEIYGSSGKCVDKRCHSRSPLSGDPDS
ncbi:MAG: hypothetical protein HY756_09990 [Nitrospirae bacterium]|nr:hypothetical protein [Nitrospirota bacterium]